MKIIDLLNKIANGEEVPKRIKYYDEEFAFTGYESASKNYNNGLEDLFEVLDGSTLNDEVEILEEEKKIPEKLNLDTDELRGKETPRTIDYLIESKVNQVIDYLKSKGE